MDIKRLYDIVILYQYKLMREENYKFIFSEINFYSLKNDENEQFSIKEITNNHIIFTDRIRKKTFEMKKIRPYSCGKFYYDIIIMED